MVFKDLIRTSDLQVPEQALLLYDCWCFFFFCLIVSVRHARNMGPPTNAFTH